jgi:hypothetical protein
LKILKKRLVVLRSKSKEQHACAKHKHAQLNCARILTSNKQEGAGWSLYAFKILARILKA